MTSRAAVQGDAEAITAIYAACFDTPWSQQTITEFIEAGDVTVLGDPPNGFLIVTKVLDEAEIITLAIHPSNRRTGYGRVLLQSKLVELANEGVGRVFLEVARDNSPARNLYEQMGFTQIGLRKEYYVRKQGVFVDALVLSRVLVDHKIVANS